MKKMFLWFLVPLAAACGGGAPAGADSEIGVNVAYSGGTPDFWTPSDPMPMDYGDLGPMDTGMTIEGPTDPCTLFPAYEMTTKTGYMTDTGPTTVTSYYCEITWYWGCRRGQLAQIETDRRCWPVDIGVWPLTGEPLP